VGVYTGLGYNKAADSIAREAARHWRNLGELVMAHVRAVIDGHTMLQRVEPGVEGTRTVRVVLGSPTAESVWTLTAKEASRLYRELGDAIGAKSPAEADAEQRA
jgi:hypothetical protein